MFSKKGRKCGLGGTLISTFLGVKKLICFDSLVRTYCPSLYKFPSSARILLECVPHPREIMMPEGGGVGTLGVRAKNVKYP